MWRSLCIVILLPSLLFAQTREAAVPTAAACSEWDHPSWRQATYYEEIRRGTSEKAAVELLLRDPRYFVTSPRSPMPDIVPLKLEFEGENGISITRTEYPKTFKLRTKRGAVRAANSGIIQFRIRLTRDLPLGLHLLKGRLTFQLATAQGPLGPPEQIDVQIPLKVVEQNAKVMRSSWPYHQISSTELILLSPLLVLVFIPMALACSLGSQWGCM